MPCDEWDATTERAYLGIEATKGEDALITSWAYGVSDVLGCRHSKFNFGYSEAKKARLSRNPNGIQCRRLYPNDHSAFVLSGSQSCLEVQCSRQCLSASRIPWWYTNANKVPSWIAVERQSMIKGQSSNPLSSTER